MKEKTKYIRVQQNFADHQHSDLSGRLKFAFRMGIMVHTCTGDLVTRDARRLHDKQTKCKHCLSWTHGIGASIDQIP